MKYLKVFTDFAEQIEALNDTEVGRLFRGMLLYADSGEVPDLKGNERFLWGTAKKNIDNQRESYDNKANAAEKARTARSNIRTKQNENSVIRKNNLKTTQEKEKDKDKEKDKENIITFSDEKVCAADIEKVVNAWNAIGLAKVSRIIPDSKRAQSVKARIREYGIDGVMSMIDKAAQSAFLHGQNKKGWMATFDWCFLPSNFPKVLEGNYDDKGAPAQTASSDAYSIDELQAIFERV